MQEMKISDLTTRAAELMESEQDSLTRKLEAQHAVRSEIEAMVREEKILTLAEEEERMLRAFRGFKVRAKPGAVFKWQTRPEPGIITAPTDVLITDPQDVSRD